MAANHIRMQGLASCTIWCGRISQDYLATRNTHAEAQPGRKAATGRDPYMLQSNPGNPCSALLDIERQLMHILFHLYN